MSATITPPVSSDGLAMAPSLEKSFSGMVDNNAWIPPDTQGAAGPAHLVSLLNRGYAVFDKDSGAIVSGPISLISFWSALGTGPGQPAADPFDPKVLYDQYSSRFVVVSDSGRRSDDSWVLIGYSRTSDPTDGFDLYAIDANITTPGEWADYPGLGVDPQFIYVTDNMFTSGSNPVFQRAKVWMIEKSSLLAGGPIRGWEFVDNSGVSNLVPTHAFGPTGVNYLLSLWSGTGTARLILVQEASLLQGIPVLADVGYLRIADFGFDTFTDAPQMGCAEGIDSFGPYLMNAVLRNGRIYTTHSVDDPSPDGSARKEIAWYEIDPDNTSYFLPLPGPIQQGRVSDPDLWFYFPSVAVNDNESVALGFTGSGSNVFASAYYTTRLASDPPGFMHPAALMKSGSSPYFKRFGMTENRWGDYSATMVDPLDDATFWTIQEHARDEAAPGCPVEDTGRWGTWWGSFKDGGCQDADGDEFGAPGSRSCPGGFLEDCNDGDPSIKPGAVEACGVTDLDCDGIPGNPGGDADGSGRVDGGDLWEWARRLGTSLLADPASIFFQMYSGAVDYDADGDVDGVDLQLLEAEFGSTTCGS